MTIERSNGPASDKAWSVAEWPLVTGWAVVPSLLELVVVVFAVLVLWSFPGDVTARARAGSVTGPWAVVSAVEVHVHYDGAKGAHFYEVDRVRVRLPGSTDWVRLIDVNSAQTEIDEVMAEGWQRPTEVTQYQPPLVVRVAEGQRNQPIHAIALDDYLYWTYDNRDAEWDLGYGLLLLGVAILAPTAWFGFTRKPRREPVTG